jgi:hypothetical protein
MATKIDYKAEFQGFVKTAEDAEWYPAISCLGAAAENANDTYGECGDNNASYWYECAYCSICETSDFNESPMVRKVLEGLGYAW